MALSIPEVRNTAQHYLVCGTKDCDRNCQFYCNPCHLLLCEQCRDEHLKSPESKNHEVVPFDQRKRKLPVEKCKIHPYKELDILCKECNAYLCSKCCTLQDHQGHTFIDLETIYDDNCQICQDRILQIEQYFFPTSQNLQQETKCDSTDIKKIFESIRANMKEEATSLKSLVDRVTSDNIDQVNKMEESFTESLKSQDKTYADYISYLNELVKKFHGYLSTSKLQNNPLISSISEALRVQPIPETPKPVPPLFTAGQFNMNDVAKLLGRVNVPGISPETRKIKPMETRGTQPMNPSGKQKTQERKNQESATKVKELKVQGVVNALWHISLDKSGKLWVSNMDTSIVQTDLQGNQLQQIQTSGGFGYHTVTRDEEMIYADIGCKVINKISESNKVTEFISTGRWKPCSIYSSRINGDILVGMFKNKDSSKVVRYNKTGKETQTIQYDNNGLGMYDYPNYIAENINGDICVSDSHKRAVVVVTDSGQHRFSYTGHDSELTPYGICTDILGQILVCDTSRNTVHLLDQNGQFLKLLFTHQVVCPHGMCVDDENNVYVCQFDNNVLVFKYLQ